MKEQKVKKPVSPDSVTIENRIRNNSRENPQKIVIDEIYPDGTVRIGYCEMKPGADRDNYVNRASWGPEQESYLNREQLGSLITEKELKACGEGKVYLITDGQVKNIYKEVREYVKNRTKILLGREGKISVESK